jgi:hypothetical protein
VRCRNRKPGGLGAEKLKSAYVEHLHKGRKMDIGNDSLNYIFTLNGLLRTSLKVQCASATEASVTIHATACTYCMAF